VVIIAWDDSDGWYDHQMPPIVNPSTNSTLGANMTLTGQTVKGLPDGLNGDGVCNHSTAQQGAATPSNPLPGPTAATAMGRCGYGPRLPLLVISPFAKKNFVDHTLTDQSSILRFIEDNWLKSVRIKGSFDALAGSFTGAGGALDFTLSTPKVFLDPATGTLINCPTCL
jgi:phospholipase C